MRSVNAESRFWDKVDKSGECWLWQAATNGRYGTFWLNGVLKYAHRTAWEIENGLIPVGMNVLHECDTPPCVRISHLFLGTQADNLLDAAAKGRSRNGQEAKTHCPQGHPYDEENTYHYRGQRHCRTCKIERQNRARRSGKRTRA